MNLPTLPNNIIENTIIFLFGTLIPLLWAGHLYVAEKIATSINHPELTEGIGHTLWIFTTLVWYHLSKIMLANFQGIIKAIMFLAVLYMISLVLSGIGNMM